MKNLQCLAIPTLLGMAICAPLFAKLPASPDPKQQIIVFLDKKGGFHWLVRKANGSVLKHQGTIVPSIPKIKKTFKSAPLPLEEVKAGGIGGNEKTGFIYYDGQSQEGHADYFIIQRNPLSKTCYLQNKDIVIRDWNKDLDVVEFPCEQPDPRHNGLYWYPGFEMTNGAYNPALDAFYAAEVANRMYQSWFYQPMWSQRGVSKRITILLHGKETYFNDGGWFSDGNVPWFVSLSDGDNKTFPWTTLDVVAHFMGIGTALSYWGYAWGVGNAPSIAMSYSDGFAKAVEYEATKKNNWSIGVNVMKYNYLPLALRFMDEPKRYCGRDDEPGVNCSIDNYAEYKKHPYLPPEYGAGLLNKVFYLIATSPEWDTKQAFTLLNHAAIYYWTYEGDWDPDDNNDWPEDHFNFRDVFCSLIDSARDLSYPQTKIDNIISALTEVGMDSTICIERLNPPK